MQAGTERPRFRQDLFAEAIDEQGAKFIDVMDPDSGTVFRFYEVEFSIACAMDGERDVPGLVKWAQDELGVRPTAHEVQTVIATLGELGYLDMTAATRAAAAEAPATSGLAAAVTTEDTVVEAPAMKVPAARTPAAASSDLSLDLSEHLEVGRADVQEAVRQSRVMAAVEVPPELAAQVSPPAERPVARPAPTPAPTPAERPTAKAPPVRPTPVPREAKAPVRPTPVPVEVKQPEVPAEAKAPVRPTPIPVEVQQPEVPAPVEVQQPEQPAPAEVRQPEQPAPVEVRPEVQKPAEKPVETRPEVQKPAVERPKVPEKQPVVPPAPTRRVSPVVIVLLILVLVGAGSFLVWKLLLDKPSQQPTGSVGAAPVAPQPPAEEPPAPPPQPSVTAKIEMSSGRPKTILAYFAGTIEWIEATGKEAKSNDVILKLRGHKPLEAQVAAAQKEVEKVKAEVAAAYAARDALPPDDQAGRQKAQAKVDAAEKAANTKADQLQKKADQLEMHYVRLIVDGTLTVTGKVGDKIAENTPIATILPPPAPSATFKIPQGVKLETGTATAVQLGEQIVTCEIADWEPETLRITCPQEPGVVEGATVSWQLP